MTLSDIFFLFLVLDTVIAAIVMIVLTLRGSFRFTFRLALGAMAVWIVYLAIGSIVAVATRQRMLSRGQERCFDEMCFRVIGSLRDGPPAHGDPSRVLYKVTVEETNRGQGRAQREKGVESFLIDDANVQYWPVAVGDGSQSLDTMLGAGDTAVVTQTYDVPASARGLGVAFAHSYALNPARIIIGDEDHFLHKPTKLLIQP